jgi:polyhydroxyalkanoate synthesis regulator protein
MTDTLTMPRLIKRYGRSRLYDPEAARYVTLAELRDWQARGLSFIDVQYL